MRCSRTVAAGVIVGLLMSVGAGGQAPPAGSLVLTNATVIDGTGGPPVLGRTIVITDGRIASVTAAPPASSLSGQIIDLDGRVVLPGLIDSHVHYTPLLGVDPYGANAVLRRQLYSGVTTVRDMAGDARLVAWLKRAIELGQLEGPDVYYAAVMAGPDFTGLDQRVGRASAPYPRGTASWQQEVTRGSDPRTAVARAAGTHASGLKFYVGVDADVIRAMTAEAHRLGLKAWAHTTVFPDRPIDVVRAGVDVTSHLCWLAWQDNDLDPSVNIPYTHTPQARPIPPYDPSVVDVDSPEMTQLFAEMAERGTLLDATYSPSALARSVTSCTPELNTALAQAARRAGVEFTTGTDYIEDADQAYPAVTREIEMLIDAGILTPMEAIVAATRNGARAIGIDATHGTIEAGKAADLVVLDANPLDSAGAFRRVVMTIKRGKVYSRADYEAAPGR